MLDNAERVAHPIWGPGLPSADVTVDSWGRPTLICPACGEKFAADSTNHAYPAYEQHYRGQVRLNDGTAE